MELRTLLRELHWIEWQLRTFEDKYGIRSPDFYQAMEAGELAEFDDIDDLRFHDFLEWHGLFKIWIRREKTYRNLLNRETLIAQLQHAPLTA